MYKKFVLHDISFRKLVSTTVHSRHYDALKITQQHSTQLNIIFNQNSALSNFYLIFLSIFHFKIQTTQNKQFGGRDKRKVRTLVRAENGLENSYLDFYKILIVETEKLPD